ncbi:hypothetical protein GVN20_00995 [Runella sp. CRIBMP]|uniref:trypsin-like serine peptidase n=1 Tax=Runella sp. CRIBMP TaxID=2683261 RepID=UPI0014136B75|nr:hypothetical protein [Runella sp. CRIBMP]NBB17918.1 hypothetical protein [Runella sp. CRIBMP]
MATDLVVGQPMSAEEIKKMTAQKAKTTPPMISPVVSEAVISSEPVPLGTRVFPVGGKSVGFKAFTKAELATIAEPLETKGFIPSFADFEPKAAAESKKDALPAFIDRKSFMNGADIETIFSPDDRRVFNSTAYPWRCFGRVESSLGSGSGVMIGPRHLLTCSHIVDWKPNNTTGWLKFTPAYYNGSAPFGAAWSTLTYYKYKVSGAGGVDYTELQYDYVVIVLDRRIGDQTGWLGSKSYTDSWDGGLYWSHVGYPGDLTGGQRPTFQGNFALNGADELADAHQYLTHKADVWPGQSGGPFFGWWNSSPYAVAIQSAHNASANFASGGSDMVNLVIRARTDHP